MRYNINFDKTINQLVPHYIGGRKLILYLQALISPLQHLNAAFVQYAKETRIEASMTSQIGKLEWYLNRRFSKYFASTGKIMIANSSGLGVPIYQETANIDPTQHIVTYHDDEPNVKKQLVLYHSNEQTQESTVSFIVTTPPVDPKLISEQKYIAMLRYAIDKYRLANKTYLIKYESK